MSSTTSDQERDNSPTPVPGDKGKQHQMSLERDVQEYEEQQVKEKQEAEERAAAVEVDLTPHKRARLIAANRETVRRMQELAAEWTKDIEQARKSVEEAKHNIERVEELRTRKSQWAPPRPMTWLKRPISSTHSAKLIVLARPKIITATGTGGLGCNFMPTKTGSISCSPDTFHIRATDTAADTAGSPGPVRAAPDCQLIRSLIPLVSATEIPGLILTISISETFPVALRQHNFRSDHRVSPDDDDVPDAPCDSEDESSEEEEKAVVGTKRKRATKKTERKRAEQKMEAGTEKRRRGRKAKVVEPPPEWKIANVEFAQDQVRAPAGERKTEAQCPPITHMGVRGIQDTGGIKLHSTAHVDKLETGGVLGK
ncbi:hypothetical protein DFH08DRAFT_814861 [Mycena albidolilacea]|uniref:Uncharacterized protein n=1 Tax=Mycena albidolilacea TaxID=1033008 RepID=A0AAD7EJW3_9AGAR|nr:hypothetical protein DFH08DRAFT_814861 [Mycena albidolilacea]